MISHRQTLHLANEIARRTGAAQRQISPVLTLELEKKLEEVFRRAIASGQLEEAAVDKLLQLAEPESVRTMTAFFVIYGLGHETPAPHFLVALDIGLTAAAGIGAATSAYLIYKATDKAVSERDLEFATDELVSQIEGPGGDVILDFLLFGGAESRKEESSGVRRSAGGNQSQWCSSDSEKDGRKDGEPSGIIYSSRIGSLIATAPSSKLCT